MSSSEGKANWLNYAIMLLVLIILITSVYSATITITPEISIPEDLAKKSDLAELVSKDDLSDLAVKGDLADVVTENDVSSLIEDLKEVKEAIEELRAEEAIIGYLVMIANPATTDPPLPGVVWAVQREEDLYYLWDEGFLWLEDDILKYGSFTEGERVEVTGSVETKSDIHGVSYSIIQVESIEEKPPSPPPVPVYTIARITLEATVLDLTKTLYKVEDLDDEPIEIYKIEVKLRIDSLVEYASDVSGLLNKGDEIDLEEYVQLDQIDFEKGDRIRTDLLLFSLKEELDLTEPGSYWWEWYLETVEVL